MGNACALWRSTIRTIAKRLWTRCPRTRASTAWPSVPSRQAAGRRQMSSARLLAQRLVPYATGSVVDWNTRLSPQDEQDFRSWVAQNNVPFDPSAGVTDYDMRGFWLGLKNGNPHARTGIDPNDHRMHFSDYWKTPLHQTFSNESKWATPGAPHWAQNDQLLFPNGTVVFDDRYPSSKVRW